MSTNAGWWDNPGQHGDDAPVVRHAPDDDQYHLPDHEQMGKMRGSKVGKFAIIPAAMPAAGDGRSRGFNANTAGPVHVDPDAPDGGVIFDPSTVRQADLSRAVSNSRYAHQAFYALGTSAAALGVGKMKRGFDQNFEQQPRYNNHLPPGGYVTPGSTHDGRQVEFQADPASYQQPNPYAQEVRPMTPSLSSLPPLHAPQQPQQMQAPAAAPMPQQQPQYAPPPQYAPQPQYAPPPQYQPYQQPAVDPNMQAMMGSMVQMQQQLAALLNERQRAPQQPQYLPPTTGVSSNPMPQGPPLSTMPVEMRRGNQQRNTPNSEDFEDEAARPIRKRVVRDPRTQEPIQQPAQQPQYQEQVEQPTTLRDYQNQDSEPEGVIVGFETLGLSFVQGPIAKKPRKVVVWEIPNAGKHLTRFHEVVVSKNNVALVYDTRYEEGTQYEPPELDDVAFDIHLEGKDAKGKKTTTTYNVSAMGFSFSLGVFDVIVLVRNNDGQAKDHDDDDE